MRHRQNYIIHPIKTQQLSLNGVVQQDAHGAAFEEAGDSIVWTADAAGSDAKFIAVFNVGDREPIDIPVNWAALHMPETCALRDLWDHRDFAAVHQGYTFHVPPHGSALYKLTPVIPSSA